MLKMHPSKKVCSEKGKITKVAITTCRSQIAMIYLKKSPLLLFLLEFLRDVTVNMNKKVWSV